MSLGVALATERRHPKQVGRDGREPVGPAVCVADDWRARFDPDALSLTGCGLTAMLVKTAADFGELLPLVAGSCFRLREKIDPAERSAGVIDGRLRDRSERPGKHAMASVAGAGLVTRK